MTFGAASAVFRSFVTDALDNTYAYDLGADTFKVALFNDTTTPDKDAAAASIIYNAGVWVVANEVTDATNWTAGGRTLSSVTWTNPSTGKAKFDAADTAGGGVVTIANAYGCMVYDSTVANRGLCYNSFGAAKSVTSGTFTIVWNSSGIFDFSV